MSEHFKIPVTSPMISYRGHGEKLLVVEDHDLLRNFAQKTLRIFGYDVFVAEDCDIAFEIFSSMNGDFHLLFSDISLPNGDGLQLVSRLLDEKPDLIVLLTSGYTYHMETIRDKGYPFIKKPYSIVDLLRTVSRLLRE